LRIMALSGQLDGVFSRIALRSLDKTSVCFPKILENLRNTVLLWPRNPDDSALKMARIISNGLGDNLACVVSFMSDSPLEAPKRMVINKDSIGFFGYPKRSAAVEIGEYTASIDLSRKFDLPLSVLPVWANIPLRIGRDDTRKQMYNVIFQGESGMEINTLLQTVSNYG